MAQEVTLTPMAMEARCLDQYARLTGPRRHQTIEYMTGVINGRWGTVSQSGRDYARRVIDAMSASEAR